MLHTIELSESFEATLRRIAQASHKTEEAVLKDVAELVLTHEAGKYGAAFQAHLQSLLEADSDPTVRRRVEVMGGDACIRDTRIPVWLLVQLKQSGWGDARLLENYPVLTSADLVAAWDFYATNSSQVEAERQSHENAA